jgi:hypothetical protein
MTASIDIDTEREYRQRRLEEAIHSSEMEGATISVELRADGARYVAGLINPDEMLERAKARYGIE